MTTTETYDPIPLTVDDALADWDAGKTVFSVDLGGLGPGYEMAIQGLAFELLRELRQMPIPPRGEDWPEMAQRAVLEARDRVVHRLDGEPWAGFSGAQVGAATSFAICVLRRPSYRAALREDQVKDRLIQVSKLDLRKAAP